MSLGDFLELAYYLSILTFYLGVLIYALPIPITGLKRWGPRLISDAFFVASLTFGFYAILNAANYIAQVLGSDWVRYFGFLNAQLTAQLSMIFGLSALTKFVPPKFAPIISKLISSLVGKLMWAVYATMFMYIIGFVIYKDYTLFASLGIALMAIPFRIARGAGAFLLAFSLVFFVALPLYPAFFSMIVVPPKPNVEIYEPYQQGVRHYEHSSPILDLAIPHPLRTMLRMQIPVSQPPNGFTKLLSTIARVVYAVLLASVLYLTLLLSISVGLARALGGFGRLRVL